MSARLQLEDGWVHKETGERISDDEIEERQKEHPEEFGEPGEEWDWELEHTCPACGQSWLSSEIPDEEMESAGLTSVHIPCADEDEIERAKEREKQVVRTINATPEHIV